MKPFTANVIAILKQIPEKKVMTYGQIAKVAGSPRGARQVVRILHSMSKKYSLPWHRVLNIKGKIVMKNKEDMVNQKGLLESEGIRVSEFGTVDLAEYQFHLDLKLDEDGS